MLTRLKRLFAAKPDQDERGGEQRLRLAAAVLLVEAARMDGNMDRAERQRIEVLLGERFGLEPDHVGDLVAEALATAEASVEWHAFTREVKNGFDHGQRIDLVEMLWDVIYVDGKLHDYEASLMRRLGGLLYVSDRELGEARRRVLDRSEGSAEERP